MFENIDPVIESLEEQTVELGASQAKVPKTTQIATLTFLRATTGGVQVSALARALHADRGTVRAALLALQAQGIASEEIRARTDRRWTALR